MRAAAGRWERRLGGGRAGQQQPSGLGLASLRGRIEEVKVPAAPRPRASPRWRGPAFCNRLPERAL